MENYYRAEISHIIALCHIIDEFEDFEERLSPKYNQKFISQLWNISQGKNKIGARKVKRFYNDNKEVIDTINKYSNILTFINFIYDFYGILNGDLKFFYEYLLKNKEQKQQILAVLGKLKELGFNDFEFDENIDFTQKTYEVEPEFGRNFYIYYVANAQVIPNYKYYVSYKTANSNYKMELSVDFGEFSDYGRDIVLNSLLFDPNTLPEKIDRENIFEPLVRAKNEQKEKCDIIRNSVDLSIGVTDLEGKLKDTNDMVNNLDSIDSKEQLLAILENISTEVKKLRVLSEQYDLDISKQEPELTLDVLKSEKVKCLKRREASKYDFD